MLLPRHRYHATAILCYGTIIAAIFADALHAAGVRRHCTSAHTGRSPPPLLHDTTALLLSIIDHDSISTPMFYIAISLAITLTFFSRAALLAIIFAHAYRGVCDARSAGGSAFMPPSLRRRRLFSMITPLRRRATLTLPLRYA